MNSYRKWSREVRRVYIAGPDVFYPDSAERGRRMEELCRQYGHDGVYPLDGKPMGSQVQRAHHIYETNTRLIDSCDVIIANLNPFRGEEPDSGTVFEVAYGIAKGKRVYGYRTDTRTQVERLGVTDKEGNKVENFGLPLNLMVCVPIVLVAGGFEDALRRMVEDLDARCAGKATPPFLDLGSLK